jgi:SOS-response transcriptional repressor LexA
MDREGYFMIIPEIVWAADIKDKAKLLYGHITVLVEKKGYCFATNNYFAEKLGVKSKKVISTYLKELEDLNLITTELIYESGSKQVKERRIRVNLYRIGPGGKINTRPIRKMSGDNKTSINKTSTLSTAGAGDGIKPPHNFTHPIEQAKAQVLDFENDWALLTKTYYPDFDRSILNRKVVNKQKDRFRDFDKEERAKIIEWFIKYKHKLRENQVWLGTFFDNNETLEDIAEFFRNLKSKRPVSEFKGDVKNNFDPNRENY